MVDVLLDRDPAWLPELLDRLAGGDLTNDAWNGHWHVVEDLRSRLGAPRPRTPSYVRGLVADLTRDYRKTTDPVRPPLLAEVSADEELVGLVPSDAGAGRRSRARRGDDQRVRRAVSPTGDRPASARRHLAGRRPGALRAGPAGPGRGDRRVSADPATHRGQGRDATASHDPHQPRGHTAGGGVAAVVRAAGRRRERPLRQACAAGAPRGIGRRAARHGDADAGREPHGDRAAGEGAGDDPARLAGQGGEGGR